MRTALLAILLSVSQSVLAATIYGISGIGHVEGYDVTSGNLQIDFGPNTGNQGLAAGDGYVFANYDVSGVPGSIHRYNAVTGVLEASFGDISTRDIAYADGVIYGISGLGEILSYDAITGDFLGGFGPNSGGQALAVGDGYLYTDMSLPQGEIHKYDLTTREFVLSFGLSNSSTGLAYLDGAVYSNKNDVLYKFDAATGDLISSAGSSTGGSHLTAGGGSVFVAAHRNGITGSIHEFDAGSLAYVRSFGDVASGRQIAYLATVPIPGALLLFCSGLLPLVLLKFRNTKRR